MAKTELLKTAKPILFNTDMVKAILDGRKTVTRRVVKPSSKRYFIDKTLSGKPAEFQMISIDEAKFIRMAKPQYKVNDILYVRETWSPVWVRPKRYQYKATPEVSENTPIKWRPSIHMPKEAARIFLKVTDVRVERLQDITVEQTIKEGFEGIPCGCSTTGCTDCYDFGWREPPQVGFMYTWDNTIKKQDLDKYGWDANPWVWVYEFERINNNENNND